jgi:hypothetical protein
MQKLFGVCGLYAVGRSLFSLKNRLIRLNFFHFHLFSLMIFEFFSVFFIAIRKQRIEVKKHPHGVVLAICKKKKQ